MQLFVFRRARADVLREPGTPRAQCSTTGKLDFVSCEWICFLFGGLEKQSSVFINLKKI